MNGPKYVDHTTVTDQMKEIILSGGYPLAKPITGISIRLARHGSRKQGVLLELGLADSRDGEWLVTWGSVILHESEQITLIQEGISLDLSKLIKLA